MEPVVPFLLHSTCVRFLATHQTATDPTRLGHRSRQQAQNQQPYTRQRHAISPNPRPWEEATTHLAAKPSPRRASPVARCPSLQATSQPPPSSHPLPLPLSLLQPLSLPLSLHPPLPLPPHSPLPLPLLVQDGDPFAPVGHSELAEGRSPRASTVAALSSWAYAVPHGHGRRCWPWACRPCRPSPSPSPCCRIRRCAGVQRLWCARAQAEWLRHSQSLAGSLEHRAPQQGKPGAATKGRERCHTSLVGSLERHSRVSRG